MWLRERLARIRLVARSREAPREQLRTHSSRHRSWWAPSWDRYPRLKRHYSTGLSIRGVRTLGPRSWATRFLKGEVLTSPWPYTTQLRLTRLGLPTNRSSNLKSRPWCGHRKSNETLQTWLKSQWSLCSASERHLIQLEVSINGAARSAALKIKAVSSLAFPTDSSLQTTMVATVEFLINSEQRRWLLRFKTR